MQKYHKGERLKANGDWLPDPGYAGLWVEVGRIRGDHLQMLRESRVYLTAHPDRFLDQLLLSLSIQTLIVGHFLFISHFHTLSVSQFRIGWSISIFASTL